MKNVKTLLVVSAFLGAGVLTYADMHEKMGKMTLPEDMPEMNMDYEGELDGEEMPSEEMMQDGVDAEDVLMDESEMDEEL